MTKKALITGITGQDGSYLAEFLLEKGYEVYGTERRVSKRNRSNIEHILDQIKLHSADITDQNSILNIISEVRPDEVYNLAAQSFVPDSFKQPDFTLQVNARGVLNILEIIRSIDPKIKFYQASTSELFGKVKEVPQDENTPFHPRSPYGISKLYGYWITINYRESYNIFACNGILFNHESPRRGIEFVSRKITDGLCRIKLGLHNKLVLGNLDAKRDWGFAGDYVKAMWLMLQQDEPDDYIIATGEHHTVKEFVDGAAKVLNIDISWDLENGISSLYFNSEKIGAIEISKEFYRPAEVQELLGDAGKGKAKLGWKQETSFEELIEMMVTSDYNQLKNKVQSNTNYP